MIRFASVFVLALAMALSPLVARADDLLEPHMRILPGGPGAPQVALTLDACSGGVDMRIINALIDNGIKATLFITGRWLRANPEAAAVLRAHADLFDFEDHGAEHVPAVIGTEKPYGISPAGTPEAVLAEVLGGARAVEAAFGNQTHYYRGATALYTPDAIGLIQAQGFAIGAFSLNADWGATATAEQAAHNVSTATDGEVIIAHMNQPTHAAGLGIVAGILALQARGFVFVRLDQATVVFQ